MPGNEDWLFGFNIYDIMRGRIVVAEKGFPDPDQLARNAQLLVGRRNDFARLYNPGATNCYLSVAPDGRKQLVQILNFAAETADYVTLWVNTRSRSAKLWRPEPRDALPMESIPANQGTDFDLPPLSVNCAVEIERLA
jgi:hypothetical protein